MVVVVVVVNFKFVWRQPVVVLEVIVNLYLVMKVGRARGDGENEDVGHHGPVTG